MTLSFDSCQLHFTVNKSGYIRQAKKLSLYFLYLKRIARMWCECFEIEIQPRDSFSRNFKNSLYDSGQLLILEL